MTRNAQPPFRADQVGSLLRVPELRAAHERALQGQLGAAALRELEDRCIREVILFQESVGLHAITDGEYRRSSFHADFIEKLDGAKAAGRLAVEDTVSGVDEKRTVTGKRFAPRAFTIVGKLRHSRPIEVENFKFVKANTERTAKQTMPSPTMLLRGGRAAVSSEAYPDLEEFHADIARVYREELRQLGDAGCRYVQLDDTNFAFLCDPKLAECFRRDGYDPDEMPGRFAKLINSVIADRPAGMVVGIHLCRGNSAGQWAAQGGYEPVAEVLFNSLAVDAYFLEYDDERSGGFEPLRFLPKPSRKRVVLGLLSTKAPALESKDALKRRIEAAAKYVPLENLCLSPQCGFASTFRGNPISEDVQRSKLERVVEVATEVWGTAR
jgi:5-methyltetrahydropteroyltriglutamate--homocysteine methyltransferase